MIRSELIQKIADENPHLTQRHVERIVNTVFEEIIEALAKGDRVELRGFGAFSVKARDARVGALQCWGVVHPIPRHGHRQPSGLQGSHKAQFVFGAGAGKDIDRSHLQRQFSLVQPVKIRTSEHAVGRLQPDLGGDGRRCTSMVAGDHLDPDARPVARGDRLALSISCRPNRTKPIALA